MKRVARFGLYFLFTTTAVVLGYDFTTSPPLKWRRGDVPINLQLDTTLTPRALQDGKMSWNAVAQEALDIWNEQLREVQFTDATGSARGDGNDRNDVFFSSHVYGQSLGYNVLAVTTTWRIGRERIEGDTIFNTDIDWDSYRGPLNDEVIDLRRVAQHEFGHTLGLDHPDGAGQVQAAVMNSRVSDLDTIAEDDIRGAHALYPGDGRYLLTILPVGSGTVLRFPAPEADGKYSAGTLVTLVAKPQRRNRFTFWGGDEIQTGRKLRVLVVDNETVTANFTTTIAPVVLTQPRSQFASSAERVTFMVRVASATPVAYQWQFDGVDLPGAIDATLDLDSIKHNDSGLYSCRITNTRGETFSKPARLVVDGY